jgi:Zn-dependent M28 family amino/carboxypeptidase
MKILIVLFIFCANSYAFEVKRVPKNKAQVKQILSNINKKITEKKLRDFVRKSFPNRFVGTDGHKKAKAFIKKEVASYKNGTDSTFREQNFQPNTSYGIDLYQKDFDTKVEGKIKKTDPEYQNMKNFTIGMSRLLRQYKSHKGQNFIWEKKGSGAKELIIGAHYDTISLRPQTFGVDTKSEMPGADDNASGLVIALNLIQLLEQLPLKHTVKIVFFDMQEIGFMGSEAFVKEEIKGKKERFYINLEMLGYDTKTFDKEKGFGNMKAYISSPNQDIYKAEKEFATTFLDRGDKTSNSIKFRLEEKGYPYGDNINFQKKKIPSIALSQNWESDFNSLGHHTSNDFPERINFQTLHNAFSFVAGATMMWALELK